LNSLSLIRELKEKNVLNIDWIPSESNCSDLFKKNLGCDMYQKHAIVFARVGIKIEGIGQIDRFD
jgi:hypothetical protein